MMDVLAIQAEDDTSTTTGSIQTTPHVYFADKATQTDFPPFSDNDIAGDNTKTNFTLVDQHGKYFCMCFLFCLALYPGKKPIQNLFSKMNFY